MPTAVQLGLSSYPSQAYGATGENLGQFPTIPADPDYSQETHPDYPQEIWNQLRDNYYSPPNIPSQLDLDRARHEKVMSTFTDERDSSGARIPIPQMRPFYAPDLTYREMPTSGFGYDNRWQALQALEKSDEVEEDYNKMQHLDIVYGTGETMSSLPKAGTIRRFEDWIVPKLPFGSELLKMEDSVSKVNKALAENKPLGDISDSIRDLVMNQVYEEAQDAGLTPEQAYVLPNVPTDRRDFEGFTNALSMYGNDLTQGDIDKFASGEFTPQDYNVQDQMAQWYERAFIDPDEYGWTRPTIEQRQEAIRGVQGAPEGFWGELQDRIANLIPGAEASVARDVEFEREQREPTWFPPTTSSGIGGMVEEPATSPFIGDAGFTPSLDARTLGGPEVGGAPAVDTFADIPVVQPGAEIPWTPPAPVVPDITQALADFSAIRDADEERRNREQDERERELEQAADDRRAAEQEARVASARNKTAEKKRIDKENKERKAEEKRISDSQAAAEKKRRASDKQMADMLKLMNETHQAYLDRKKKEEDRRLRQGYGVGDMWT